MNLKFYLYHLVVFIYTYFFLSSWDVPTHEVVAIDQKAINRWIDRTNLRMNIYWNEFQFLIKTFKLYLNLKKYN